MYLIMCLSVYVYENEFEFRELFKRISGKNNTGNKCFFISILRKLFKLIKYVEGLLFVQEEGGKKRV